MKKSSINKPSIKLVGLATRTRNQDEMNPVTAKIGPLIADYFSHGVASTLVHRENPGVTYSVYTEYESDHHGEYTYFVGEEVSSFDNIPDGLRFITIPASDYQCFTTSTGQMPAVVIEAWQHIWQMDAQALGGERSYVADFEVYDERASDPNQAVVDVYIGTR